MDKFSKLPGQKREINKKYLKEEKYLEEYSGIDTIHKFKELILRMRRGIPQWTYYGYLEKLIPDKHILDYYIKREVFVKYDKKSESGQDMYFLGVTGISLANDYILEELTQTIRKLTIGVIALSLITALIIISSFIITVLRPQ